MTFLLKFVSLLFCLILISDQHVIGQNNKGQELFQLRQNIYAARQLLQNECPALFSVNHGIYDDSLFPFHLEIAKIVHSRLLNHLVKCLATQSIPAENVTSQPLFNQSRAMEEATSIPTTSQQLLTEPPTTEQYVTSEMPTPQDCQELYNEGNRFPGVYQINPFAKTGPAFPVWCDFIDGHGWTVFQKRFNGSVDFSKNWTDYQTGFGDTDGEYWLGLDKIYALTSTNTKLSILLKAADGNTESGIWQSFHINDSSDGYRLTISNDGYRGSLGSSGLDDHNGMKFSTPDRDQDNNGGFNCAQHWKGGWWFNYSCHYSLLNGVYGASSWGGIMWMSPSNHFTESVMRVTRN